MLTPYQKRQKDEEFDFDDVDIDRKEQEEGRMLVQNKQNVRRWRYG